MSLINQIQNLKILVLLVTLFNQCFLFKESIVLVLIYVMNKLERKSSYASHEPSPLQYIYSLRLIDYLGFSFFPVQRAQRAKPLTETTLNLTPGISPTACPFLPNPAIKTSSFSARQLRQPSRGTKAVTFLPFFFKRTLTHFLTAELGCLASTPTFSVTIPLANEEPAKGFLHLEPKAALLYSLSAHLTN